MIKKFLSDSAFIVDNFKIEKFLYSNGFCCVAGCDEAGRGPLAGPVVAACVHLPLGCDHSIFIDSKVLSATKRSNLYDSLYRLKADIGIGMVSEREIERLNIHQASLLAMKKALLNNDAVAIDFLLVDGKFTVPTHVRQEPLIKGESKSASIAAASIIAKVKRDRIMKRLHEKFPAYNFAKNKGYPTREHRLAIKNNGPCPAHRVTFKGVRECVK